METSSDDNFIPSDSDAAVSNESPGSAGDSRQRAPAAQHVRNKGTGQESVSEDASSPSSESGHSHAARRPLKRRQPPGFTDTPFKRQKQTFNAQYLVLLNQDIQDTAVGIVTDGDSSLAPSQLGVTRWNHIEKEAFFSALGRLGRDDLPGIAARIGTKGPLEVQQYIMLLSERERERRGEGYLNRRTLKPVDIPAAAEISQECCNALDACADDLALRQENHEASIEEKRWGHSWLITEDVALNLESPDTELPFAEFLHTRNWLKLSKGVFMNSSLPEYNWRYASDGPPDFRATALSDFHALAVSVTKRLVAATLYMSASRIKAKMVDDRRTKHLVRERDVQAAVDSLGMKPNSREFWARAATRLRLDVYDDVARSDEESEESKMGDDEEEKEDEGVKFMSYEEVEAALAERGTEKPDASTFAPRMPFGGDDGEDSGASDDSDISLDDDVDDDMEGTQMDTETTDDNAHPEALSVQRDLKEARFYSANFQGTTRARNALQSRIEVEHARETEAEMADAQASAREEAFLLAVLRQQVGGPQIPLPARTAEQDLPETKKRWGFHDVVEKDWRESLKYVSEWETTGYEET